MCKSRILIVDDDEVILAALGFSFDLLLPGCQVSTFLSVCRPMAIPSSAR